MAKLGEAREQFTKEENPITIKVISDAFNGEIMVINEDQFDSKTMKRVNEHGQLIDEKGRVYQESIPKQNVAPKETKTA